MEEDDDASDDDGGEKRTSAESDGGICCNGRACQGNRRRRTCNIQFEDPPLMGRKKPFNFLKQREYKLVRDKPNPTRTKRENYKSDIYLIFQYIYREREIYIKK